MQIIKNEKEKCHAHFKHVHVHCMHLYPHVHAPILEFVKFLFYFKKFNRISLFARIVLTPVLWYSNFFLYVIIIKLFLLLYIQEQNKIISYKCYMHMYMYI